LQPRSAVCPICNGWITRGEVPIQVAVGSPGNFHTNCPHLWAISPPKMPEGGCADLWKPGGPSGSMTPNVPTEPIAPVEPEAVGPEWKPDDNLEDAMATSRQYGLRVAYDEDSMIELMADSHEKFFGWDESHPRSGFISNWKRNLKGTKPSDEGALKILNSVNKQASTMNVSHDAPIIIRKPLLEEASAGAEQRGGHIIMFESDDVLKRNMREVLEQSPTNIPDTYDDFIGGAYAHELGHYRILTGEGSIKNTMLGLSDDFIRTKISRYALVNQEEFFAEIYAMAYHPEYDLLSDEVKTIVQKVLQ